MLVIRSVLFNVLFYLNLFVQIVAALPTLVMPRSGILAVAKFWARSNLWLLRVICGTKVDFRGVSKIYPGPMLVAAKHQSSWETFALLLILPDPAYIMKRELMWIPFFGWYAWKAGMIAVDRSKGARALADMNARARKELARNRQIVIFPEGTRRAPGAEPRYKHGVAHLYRKMGVACLPIALNSGLFWPRRSIRRYRGTIRVEALDPIPPGLGRKAFLERLQCDIEAASTRTRSRGRARLCQGRNRGRLAPVNVVIRSSARTACSAPRHGLRMASMPRSSRAFPQAAWPPGGGRFRGSRVAPAPQSSR